jgi:crotonobetainyl-CoA:carnitine CoA-transferase CaiB-like acyl-CoA transferase
MVGERPLTGLRVLDLTRFVAGSYATMVLAALGADVIKIEVPPTGDPYRAQGTAQVAGQSALFQCLNNGKRSLALDFRRSDAGPVIRRLLQTCDFLVENARPGSLSRHGLDYDAVHRENPRVIYGSISAYGHLGPHSDRGGFDLTLQAEGGLMAVTGSPESGPVKVGAPVLDIGAGMSCVVGLLTAHIVRLQSGTGGHVHASLFEFSIASLTTLASAYFASGAVPERLGSHSPVFAPYGAFATSDGEVILSGAGTEELWRRLCDTVGLGHLVDEPRFRTNADRVANRADLSAALEEALGHRSTEEWLELFAERGVPAGEVRALDRVLDSSQAQALGILQRLGDRDGSRYTSVGMPFSIEGDDTTLPGPSPLLGQHTVGVLSELGYSAQEIGRLATDGVVVVP